MRCPEYYKIKTMLGDMSDRVTEVIDIAKRKHNVTVEELGNNRSLVMKIKKSLAYRGYKAKSKLQQDKIYKRVRSIYK